MSSTKDAFETIEFAGFLTDEEENTVYVSDAQGAWMIPRKEVIKIEDWKVPASLKSLKDTGKPVRVIVRKGCTLYEIRPWHLDHPITEKKYKANMDEKSRRILTAGSPSSTKMMDNERLIELEKQFMRKLGWNPNDYSTAEVGQAGTSKTLYIIHAEDSSGYVVFAESDADF
jgi:hypothetical protein